MTAPTLDDIAQVAALPFVRNRDHRKPGEFPKSFWHVKPSGDDHQGWRMGRLFAREAIAAMPTFPGPLNATVCDQRGRRDPIIYWFLSKIGDALARDCPCGIGPLNFG